MKFIKIIGLPVLVTERHRIVLDSNVRTLYNITDDKVSMKLKDNFIFVNSFSVNDNKKGDMKLISAGRFNLPMNWVKQNEIDVGDFLYLIPTNEGIIICPKNLELTCIGGLI